MASANRLLELDAARRTIRYAAIRAAMSECEAARVELESVLSRRDGAAVVRAGRRLGRAGSAIRAAMAYRPSPAQIASVAG